MAKRGHRTIVDRILLSLTALFVLGGFMALGFLKNISRDNRALLVMVSSFGMLACLVGLMLVSAFWKRLRKWTWKRALASWIRDSHAGRAPKFIIADGLAESELRQLAAQFFCRIGYRIAGRAEVGAYLALINPEGQLELVACKQGTNPIELHHVYSLELEMRRTKAVRGFFWAPGGFTGETIDWAVHQSIVLADKSEIERFIDCARVKGSRVLE